MSEVGSGTLNFGEQKKWGVDRIEALRILETFANAGGTLLDTAPKNSGGVAEEIAGEFICCSRDRMVVATV